MRRGLLSGSVVLLVAAMAILLIFAGVRQLARAAGRDTDDIYTIDVNETGFTPNSCKLNRNDSVRFRNAGTTPRRVMIPDPNFPNASPIFDSGLLRPGEVSNYYVFVYGGHQDFYDAADGNHKFTVTLPVLVEKWDEVCLGNPVAPTATPTAAGSPSPTGSASPSATVTPPTGARCRGYSACVVTMAVASDR